jgi:subtilisin family serine protease
MKNKNLQISLIIGLVLASSFSFFSFKDNQSTRMVNPKVIERISDGALYEKGVINLKFKSQIFTFSDLKFGVSKLDNQVSAYGIQKVSQRFPLKKNFQKWMRGDEDLAKFFSFEYTSNTDPFDLAKLILDNNKDILEWCEPAFVCKSDFVPNDPSTSTQYHISKINAFQAWDITRGDTNTVIGIVDSGSDLDHPDLEANIKLNRGEMGLDGANNDKKSNGIDDDGNGFIDDWRGWELTPITVHTFQAMLTRSQTMEFTEAVSDLNASFL